MPGATHLLTIGYAGYAPDSFVARLRDHDVETIVDIRQNPVSRKRGFSKSKLEEFLCEHGICYVHLRELGVPAYLRDRLRSGDCSLGEYFADFARYLSTQDDTLELLQTLASSKRCCLLCVESRPEDCHRSIVAKAVVDRDQTVRVTHI